MHSDTQLLDLYRRWWVISQRRAEATISHYLVELSLLQAAMAGGSLLEADRLTLEAFVSDRAETSSHTGRWAYRAVRSFYAWALDRELLDPNPAGALESPKEDKNPQPATVTDDILDRLLNAIDPDHPLAVRDRAVIEVLFSTGVRRGELIRMELHHVDLAAATIIIPITKTKTPRVVPLTERAMHSLVAWLEQRFRWQATTEHLWLAKHRGNVVPLSANAVRLLLEKHRTTAGVHVSSHAFRRGATVNLLRRGVSGPSVERILGRSIGSPMMAQYSRSLGQELAIEEFRKKVG